MSLPAGFASDVLWPSDAERAKYTIGWIAPMPVELSPALALLDSVTTLHVVNDSNIYKAGKISNHHVVMVTLDKIGLGGILSVTERMYSSFRELKHLFLVGLGGGMPEFAQGEQMVLGDVVVSLQVEHLDCGRRTPNGFEFTHQTYWPNPDLLKAVNTLRSTHLLNGTRVPQTLQGIRQKLYQNIRNNPEDLGPDADHLFDPGYHHQDDAKLCDNCCDPRRSKSRQERGQKAYRARDSPLIHYGTIGSGNSLVVGSKEREHLYAEFRTICFEMEAAALMNYRCLVIRGISDYSDSHKNKAWQPYAAATAAAYAQELIMQLPAPVHDVNIDRLQTLTINNEGPSTSRNCHWTVYRSRNPLFTGRDDIVRELETIIRNALKDPSYTDQCSVVIYGMGGQGKSEICLQLAYRVRHIFWGVFWVDVSSTSSAKNDFLNIAKKLGIHAETMEEARQGLANVQHSWLLVLDNADDPDVDYQCYFPSGQLGVIIMTSRNSECHRYANTPAVELGGLFESDARELLLHAIDLPREQWRTFQDDAKELATLLQSHPLALMQAGAYISRAHCTIAEYPRIFSRQRKQLLKFRPKQAQSRYGDVYATFEASAGLIQESQAEAAKDALQLLSVLGICAASRLPLQRLFEEGWKGAKAVSSYNSSNKEDGFCHIDTWLVSHLPPLLQADADAWDPFRLVEAVQLLKSLSLVSADTHDDFLSVSMHPLTNAWALDRLVTAAQHKAWLAAGCLATLSNHDDWFLVKLGRQLQPHLWAFLSFRMNDMFASGSPTNISYILTRCGWLLYDMRDLAKLKDLVDNLMLYLNLNPLIADERWLSVYELLAQSLRNYGETPKAVSLLEQIVQIQEQILAKDHKELLASQRMLGSAYLDNKQIEKAVAILEQVVQIWEQILAEDQPERLASQRTLATAYLENKQIEKAVAIREQSVHMEEQTLAVDHLIQLISQHELAKAYQANEQAEKAASLLEQVVQVMEQTLAEDHPERLTSQHNMATCLWDLNHRDAALHMMKHVVEVRRKVLHETHPARTNSEKWLKDFEDEMIETSSAEYSASDSEEF